MHKHIFSNVDFLPYNTIPPFQALKNLKPDAAIEALNNFLSSAKISAGDVDAVLTKVNKPSKPLLEDPHWKRRNNVALAVFSEFEEILDGWAKKGASIPAGGEADAKRRLNQKFNNGLWTAWNDCGKRLHSKGWNPEDPNAGGHGSDSDSD